MNKLKDQKVYEKVKQHIRDEIEDTLDIINELIQSVDLDSKTEKDQVTKKIANYFIILANCNNALTLVKNIKPSRLKESKEHK